VRSRLWRGRRRWAVGGAPGCGRRGPGGRLRCAIVGRALLAATRVGADEVAAAIGIKARSPPPSLSEDIRLNSSRNCHFDFRLRPARIQSTRCLGFASVRLHVAVAIALRIRNSIGSMPMRWASLSIWHSIAKSIAVTRSRASRSPACGCEDAINVAVHVRDV